MLSVILPSYNEEKMIAKATARMAEILQPEKIDYELLFIDDGSRDGTWAQINEAAEKDSHVDVYKRQVPQHRRCVHALHRRPAQRVFRSCRYALFHHLRDRSL